MHCCGGYEMSHGRVSSVIGGLAVFAVVGSAALRAQPSAADCDWYARDYARDHSANGQMVRGAAGGALLGAGIGALAGGAGVGAAIGAGVGVLRGGVRRSHHASSLYNYAYHECIAGRAHW